jgi:hypothetical protein
MGLIMNVQQIIDLLKGLTISGGPLAVAIAVFVGGDNERANVIAGAVGSIITIIGVAWTIIDATKRAQVMKAASQEGVQVHVNTATADPGVVAAAVTPAKTDTDPVASVVPMEGGERTDKM